MKPISHNILNNIKRRNFIPRGSQKIGRYGFLLLSLFFIIAVRPFLEDLSGAALFADILVTCALVSGVYALSDNRLAWRFASLLTSIIILLKIVRLFNENTYLYTSQVVLWLVFFSFILVVILRHLFTTSEITPDIIIGSACAYVLFGFVWAYIYFLLELHDPNSFKSPDHGNHDSLWDFIYYSFVTLTTLGYGDMLAATNQARGLSVLEAIVGQLYLAIMVARLVGMLSQNVSPKNQC
jgi:hypothetical protein